MSVLRFSQPITLVGVASDLGAEARGSRDISQLLRSVTSQLWESGRPFCVAPLIHPALVRPTTEPDQPQYYVEEVSKLATTVYSVCHDALNEGRLPLLVGGDHSVSIGAARAAAHASTDKGCTSGVLWMDSHPDLNTFNSSPSGRIHGMALAAILGIENRLAGKLPESSVVEPHNTQIFGVQAIDEFEEHNLLESCVAITRLETIREQGIHKCVESVIRSFRATGAKLYLSIDLDILNPEACPGVNAPCASGLQVEELFEAIKLVIESLPILAVDIVEFNRQKDRDRQTERVLLSLVRFLTQWLP